MRSRLVALILIAAAFMYACGPRPHSSAPSSRKPATSGPLVASSLDVRVGDEVSFVLHVTNNAAKRLELMFPSGQTHDIVVLDSLGREVWRWSEGRMYTQALKNRVLEAAESAAYRGDWRPEELHGKFVAVASLMSQNYPIEARIGFEIP